MYTDHQGDNLWCLYLIWVVTSCKRPVPMCLRTLSCELEDTSNIRHLFLGIVVCSTLGHVSKIPIPDVTPFSLTFTNGGKISDSKYKSLSFTEGTPVCVSCTVWVLVLDSDSRDHQSLVWEPFFTFDISKVDCILTCIKWYSIKLYFS